jgi:dipeptidyl aminopeptidase/acylaminoacyl peptidase
MKSLGSVISVFFLFLTLGLSAQLTKEDYQRADSTVKFNDLVYNADVRVNWIDSTSTFWYSVKTRKGTEYKLVDAVKLITTSAFDQEKLSNAMNAATNGKTKPFDLGIRKLKFIENRKKITFELENSKWECDLKGYKLKKLEELKVPEKEPYWGISDDEQKSEPVNSPDSIWTAFIKNYNVYLKEKKTVKEFQLSYDGCAADYYSCYINWSPDSKSLAVNKIRKHEKQYIHFIESSPKDQLQPKLHEREYLKPGDLLPVKRPCLFNIERKEQIPVETSQFENQYDLSNLKWWPDSKGFTFEFNQRGHQLYQVAEVDASTGAVKILIEEKFDTYVEYSGKHFRHDVEKSKEIVWASERDGWNHLYLFDASAGTLKSQITKGEWVVREVVNVDDKNRSIIFKGSGKNEGEDPYFIHYYKINFDGTGLVDFTPEHMDHDAEFSADYAWFTDTYSTVTVPPVTVLRSTIDGKVLLTLETADISDLLAKNWKKPEVFVAKARDGKTDIWGNIYFPTTFDPSKKYPVVEYIYAGPHGSFVQKSFRPFSYAFSGLCELGFIIVTIDGMGTSNRSKAFQDICFKNLKDAGFPDRILWMKAAAETRPFMDITRVGIFGASAGGQSSTGAVLFHPEFYKVAVSACGCQDNRMDKMWWNEQWMGYPVGKQYEECSNVVNAGKLEGKLMLIVGEMDDNVDPASTMQVADALTKAKKDFELVVLPGSNHTLGGSFGEQKRRDFFVKNLLGESTPDWNKKE